MSSTFQVARARELHAWSAVKELMTAGKFLMRVETLFAVAVSEELITQNWTTRPPERHLTPAFENACLTQANKKFGYEAVSY